MERVIRIIKDHIAECEKLGNTFNMPHIEDVEVTKRDLPSSGSALLHQEYKLTLQDGGIIYIDYSSKDKCRTFQINPDRSVISVKCSDSKYDFCDAWDEHL